MADFNTAFEAQRAMEKSVESIFADASLTEPGRVEVLRKNAEQYAEYVGVSVDHARGFVAKLAGGAGSAPATITKIIKKDADPHGLLPRRREKLPDEQEGFPEPDPALFKPRLGTAKMQHATNGQMLRLAQGGLAEEVRKVRIDNPRMTEHEARKRVLAENPGLYEGLRKLAFGPENELAKRSSGVQIEVAAKIDEIRKAEPKLTYAQAYTKAALETPGLMKRLLRGDA